MALRSPESPFHGFPDGKLEASRKAEAAALGTFSDGTWSEDSSSILLPEDPAAAGGPMEVAEEPAVVVEAAVESPQCAGEAVQDAAEATVDAGGDVQEPMDVGDNGSSSAEEEAAEAVPVRTRCV